MQHCVPLITRLVAQLALLGALSAGQVTELSAQQCATFESSGAQITLSKPEICVGSEVEVTVSGVVAGSGAACKLQLHRGTTPDFEPSDATLVLSETISPTAPPLQPPEIKGIQRMGCPSERGSGLNGGEENEFLIMYAGSGFAVDEFHLELEPSWNDNCATCNNPGQGNCGWITGLAVQKVRGAGAEVHYVGRGDDVPADALVLVFTSSKASVDLDISQLCSNGTPLYVMQASCERRVGDIVQHAFADDELADANLLRTVAVTPQGQSVWQLSGRANGSVSFYHRVAPTGQSANGDLDCGTGLVWRVGISDTERAAAKGAQVAQDITFRFDASAADCGTVYFKSVIVCPDGNCDKPTTPPSTALKVRCPTLTVSGKAEACVGQSSFKVATLFNDIAPDTKLEFRLDDGPWNIYNYTRFNAVSIIPYNITERENNRTWNIEFRFLPDNNGCVPVILGTALLEVGGASCCNPPDAGAFAKTSTTVCASDPSRADISGNDEEGLYARTYSLYTDADTLSRISNFAFTEVPRYSEIAQVAGGQTTVYLVARYARQDGSKPKCTEAVIQQINIDQPEFIRLEEEICPGERLEFPDNAFIDKDNLIATYKEDISDSECKRVVEVTAKLLPVSEEAFPVSLCVGESFELPDGTFLTEAAPRKSFLRPGTDGDCAVRINAVATFDPLGERSETVNLCPGQSFELPDKSVVDEQRPSATYEEPGEAGACAVLVTVSAKFNSLEEVKETQQLCKGDSLLLPNDQFLSEALPKITYKRTGADGACAVLVTVTAEFTEKEVQTESISLCTGERFTLPDGQVLNASSPTATYIKFGQDGECDTTVTATATIANGVTQTENIALCNGASFTLPDGQVLDASSPTATYTKFGHDGECDTTVTTSATIVDVVTQTENIALCNGASFTLPDGQVLDASSPTAKYTKFGHDGECDTTVTTSATIADVVTQIENIALCNGANFTLPDGQVLDASSPTATYTKFGHDGECDTTVTTSATIADVVTQIENIALCNGANFTLPDGQVLAAGSLTATYTKFGRDGECDTTVTASATIAEVVIQTENIVLCNGASFTLPDGQVLAAGSLTATYTKFGHDGECDTTVTTSATIADVVTQTENFALCAGASFALPDGQVLAASSLTATYTKFGQDGECDTTVTASATIAEVVTQTENIVLCNGASFTLPDGQVLAASSLTATYTKFGRDGECDTTVTATATIADVVTQTESIALCNGASFTLPDGQVLAAGSLTATYTKFGQGGDCDTTVNVTATFSSGIEEYKQVSLCAGSRYLLPDSTYLGASRLEATLIKKRSGSECDTTVYYTASINIKVEVNKSISLCAEERLDLPGGFVDATQPTYSYTETGVNGACDTTYTVSAAILKLSFDTLTPRICFGDDYSIAGGVYNENRPSGTYTVPFNGTTCDSLTRYVELQFVDLSERLLQDTFYVDAGETMQISTIIDEAAGGSFLWIGEGLSCDSCPDPSLVGETSKVLTLMYTSAEGCVRFDSTYLLVAADTTTNGGNGTGDVEPDPDVEVDSSFSKRPFILFPTAFSPNGDERNDLLAPVGESGSGLVEFMRVFDRWGSVVYQATDFEIGAPGLGWDGSYGGMPMESGTYVVVARIRYSDGKQLIISSDVTLMRAR